MRSISIVTSVRVFVQIILCMYEEKKTRNCSFYLFLLMKQIKIKWYQIKTKFYQTKNHDKKKCLVKLFFCLAKQYSHNSIVQLKANAQRSKFFFINFNFPYKSISQSLLPSFRMTFTKKNFFSMLSLTKQIMKFRFAIQCECLTNYSSFYS